MSGWFFKMLKHWKRCDFCVRKTVWEVQRGKFLWVYRHSGISYIILWKRLKTARQKVVVYCCIKLRSVQLLHKPQLHIKMMMKENCVNFPLICIDFICWCHIRQTITKNCVAVFNFVRADLNTLKKVHLSSWRLFSRLATYSRPSGAL